MLPKETLLGRYSIEKKIGEGGFGIVYLAKDTRIERKVAIKTIASDPDSSEFDDALRLFLREIQAIAKLDHPHILPLYDFGETTLQEANYTYMVMPYREEGTLGNWLKLRKDNKVHFPSLEDVAYILDQAADALQQAHNHNILHLDVKPSNFLIRKNKENPNRPYLLLADFGIAKFVNTSAELTKARRGTPYYMPPEQWDKNRVPEPASDQYALAVTIYQLLTYKQVFEGDNELQIQFQHLNDTPTPPSTLNPLIPPEIDTVILTALAKDPKKRYPSITAFANAFRQALIDNASTRVILSISKTEAETGGSYPLKLSNGRQITVAIPPGVQDGQEIHQEGLGIPIYNGGANPALITTIVIKPESESERKLASQLQSLEQKIQSLRTVSPVDQNMRQEIQQISKQLYQLSQTIAPLASSYNNQSIRNPYQEFQANNNYGIKNRRQEIPLIISRILYNRNRILGWLCFIALNLIIGLRTGFFLSSVGDHFGPYGEWFYLSGIGAAIVGLVFLLAKGSFLVEVIGSIALALLGNLALLTFCSPIIAFCGFSKPSITFFSTYPCFPFQISVLSCAVLILFISMLLLLLGTFLFILWLFRKGNTTAGLIFGACLIIAGPVVSVLVQQSISYNASYYNSFHISVSIPYIAYLIWLPSTILGVLVIIVTLLTRSRNRTRTQMGYGIPSYPRDPWQRPY